MPNKRTPEKKKSCPLPIKSYLHDYNPELIAVFKNNLDDIEVNLTEASEQKSNRKRANFW